MPWLNNRVFKGLAASFLLLPLACGVQAAQVKDSLKVVSQTNRSAVDSQKKIDGLARDSQGMLEEYRKLQDGTEYEAAYTRELGDAQADIQALNRGRAELTKLQDNVVTSRALFEQLQSGEKRTELLESGVHKGKIDNMTNAIKMKKELGFNDDLLP